MEMDVTSVQTVQATRAAFAAILRDQTVASGGLGGNLLDGGPLILKTLEGL